MIFTFIFHGIGILLAALGSMFSGIFYLFPDEILEAVTSALSYVKYFHGIFPVADLLTAFSVTLTAWIGMYVVKGVIWLLSHAPFFRANPLPTVTSGGTNTTDLRSVPRGTVDLKYGKPKGRVDKRMRF